MMELFDKKFVHFMWDDELEGKECFFSDNIIELKSLVRGKANTCPVDKSNDGVFPFNNRFDGMDYKFAYYDPNYEVKKAFSEGKDIQYKASDSGRWCDFNRELGPCLWNDTTEYRVKPEDEKWIVFLARQKNGLYYLTSCTEDNWESVQKIYNAKTKLFVGTKSEAEEWYEARQIFAQVIKAWEDGKKIQFSVNDTYEWQDIPEGVVPQWFRNDGYRVKPEDSEKGTAGNIFNYQLKALDEEHNDGYAAGYQAGYIAGAKAHQAKWHDLSKDPNDLPKDSDVCVLAAYDFGHWNGAKVQNTTIMTAKDFRFYNVSAWCEIPKFKE